MQNVLRLYLAFYLIIKVVPLPSNVLHLELSMLLTLLPNIRRKSLLKRYMFLIYNGVTANLFVLIGCMLGFYGFESWFKCG